MLKPHGTSFNWRRGVAKGFTYFVKLLQLSKNVSLEVPVNWQVEIIKEAPLELFRLLKMHDKILTAYLTQKSSIIDMFIVEIIS